MPTPVGQITVKLGKRRHGVLKKVAKRMRSHGPEDEATPADALRYLVDLGEVLDDALEKMKPGASQEVALRLLEKPA